jgi:hypothetical protein
MMIIGVDYHPSFQTIAFLMEETGECGDQELNHSDGQAEKFYPDLKQRGICVQVGMEAIFPLVRATAGGVGVRGMDGRSRGDQGQASEEAEVRPRGRPTHTPADAGK